MPEMSLRPARVTPVPLAQVAARAEAPLINGAHAEVLITGVTVDSREVARGDLFGALPGLQVHGATFAAAVRDGSSSAETTK